jgi:hypothetical protein
MGADPNVKGKAGDTPLHLYWRRCAYSFEHPIVDALIKYGADINITNDAQKKPFNQVFRGSNNPNLRASALRFQATWDAKQEKDAVAMGRALFLCLKPINRAARMAQALPALPTEIIERCLPYSYYKIVDARRIAVGKASNSSALQETTKPSCRK